MKNNGLVRHYRPLKFSAILAIFMLLSLAGCYHPRRLPIPTSLQPYNMETKKDTSEASLPKDTSNTLILTEDEAVRMALSHEIQVEVLSKNIDIANSKLKSAGALNNPELRIEKLQSQDLDGKLRSIEIGLRWQPPTISELSAEKDIARAEVELEKTKLTRFKQKFSAQVRKACVEITNLTELIGIYDKRIKIETSKISVLESQIALGERTSLDLTRAQLRLFRANEERNQFARFLKIQKQNLATFLKTQSDVRIAANKEKPVEETKDQLILAAYQKRPELQEIQSQNLRSQAKYHLEKMKAVPWFSFLEPMYRMDSRNKHDRVDQWGELSVGFDLPIFDLNLGNIRAGKMAIDRDITEFERTRIEIEAQVTESYMAYQDILVEQKKSQKEASSLIANADQVIKNAQQVSVVDPIKSLDLQLEILDVQESLAQKQRRLDTARINLMLAAGIIGD